MSSARNFSDGAESSTVSAVGASSYFFLVALETARRDIAAVKAGFAGRTFNLHQPAIGISLRFDPVSLLEDPVYKLRQRIDLIVRRSIWKAQ